MRNPLLPCAFLGTLTGLVACSSIDADPSDSTPHWPQFLGPGGLMRVEEATAVPLSFDLERDVRFKVVVPAGSSSPCVVGDRLFLTAHEGADRHMLAFDRHTGAPLWRRTRTSPGLGPRAHVDADPAAPTPCSDGERVVFYFGGIGLVVFDLDGVLLWEQQLEAPKAPFGIGTSPILVDDLVILCRDACPDSAILALDKVSGAERWRRPRLGAAPSFGTPLLWDDGARRQLVFAGSNRLLALDPASGEELWTVTGLADLVCTTPTAQADMLYFAAWSTGGAPPAERARASWGGLEFTAEELSDGTGALARLDQNGDGQVSYAEMPPSRAKDAFAYLDGSGDGVLQSEELLPMLAMPASAGRNLMVAVGAGGEGDVTETHVRWTARRGLPYVASPLLYEGCLYLVKSGGFVTCLNPLDGKAHYDRERLGDTGEYYSTPIGVQGHVLVSSHEGSLFVLEAGEAFRLVRQVDFGEGLRGTPAVVDGTLYVRTETSLYAFGEAD